MKISIEGTRQRALFLALLLLVAGSFSFAAGKVWLAAHWSDSSNGDDLLRAVRLEPDNAEYWSLLGRFEQWDIERANLQHAIHYIEKSTERNPHSELYWMDLAGAYESLEQASRAQDAYAKAKTARLDSPEVAWRYGNFLLRQNIATAASAELRRALLINPALVNSTLSLCWNTGMSTAEILDGILPAKTSFYLPALDFFISQHEEDSALAVWERMLKLKQPFEMKRAVPLVNYLVEQDRIAGAQRVWQQALLTTNTAFEANPDSQILYNSGFEHDLINGGFDWRKLSIPNASFDLDTSVAHSGRQSLRVTFDGTGNLDFDHLQQWVVVVPRQHYRFSAYLRTEGITTDSGIRFQLHAPHNPEEPQKLTADLTGTHPWSKVETEFTTGPKTTLLIIALRRIPTRKFDNKLGGAVWVDDVSLTPVGQDAKASFR